MAVPHYITVIESVFGELPAIESERLVLRRVAITDAPEALVYISDPEVVHHVPLVQGLNLKDARAFLQNFLDNYEGKRVAPWGVYLKSDGRHIGICGYENWGPNSDRAEMGFLFARDTWGQGFAREAAQAAIDFGFETMRLNRIEARTKPENVGAQYLLERLGMTLEGVLRENMRWKGAYHDMMMYALLRRDHLARSR